MNQEYRETAHLVLVFCGFVLISFSLQPIEFTLPSVTRGYEFSPQIKRAIATASLHVAILSPRYAESYWCLEELLLMLEPRRAKMVPIISVFYGVTPAEVRWTRGKDEIYAQALKRLAKKRTHEGKLRYDSNTVKIGEMHFPMVQTSAVSSWRRAILSRSL